ncbi:hypothetical protein PC9H_011873 [Pleurotus ostreatus]|uniref:Uncharacterized protein n=1 Tax=Pleurotus ostreatus TaxID=5322 RepID=A0A8H6ZM96_PLEOS|nr:uncharacterized protein PC9H_011873 [Pleurotus ostreatus]KAF7421350.1 hypothetical protein PC9H_011873 [Pleurotus ostreatus]KAJ8690912.1 hypothetical protein PTI98_012308 [Pleurotus ostreatus]
MSTNANGLEFDFDFEFERDGQADADVDDGGVWVPKNEMMNGRKEEGGEREEVESGDDDEAD